MVVERSVVGGGGSGSGASVGPQDAEMAHDFEPRARRQAEVNEVGFGAEGQRLHVHFFVRLLQCKKEEDEAEVKTREFA